MVLGHTQASLKALNLLSKTLWVSGLPCEPTSYFHQAIKTKKYFPWMCLIVALLAVSWIVQAHSIGWHAHYPKLLSTLILSFFRSKNIVSIFSGFRRKIRATKDKSMYSLQRSASADNVGMQGRHMRYVCHKSRMGSRWSQRGQRACYCVRGAFAGCGGCFQWQWQTGCARHGRALWSYDREGKYSI